MTSRPPRGWHRTAVGDEVVLRGRFGGATLLFGEGPARTGPLPVRRVAALLDDLGNRVTAIRWCRQVHGRQLEIVSATGGPKVGCVGECDGLMTGEPGVALTVFTADCVPLLLVGHQVVAAVHVGWRGAAAAIAPETVARCEQRYGETPQKLSVFLGPAVSGARYQVGSEVIAALQAHGVEESAWRREDRVDLRGFLEAQLRAVGVATVERVGGCTASSPGLASYRRDGAAAGRQLSLIYRSD